MKREEKNNGLEETLVCPYDDLFIYTLEGELGKGYEMHMGGEFIGNWVEGDDNFLFFSAPSQEKVRLLQRKRPATRLTGEYYFTYEQWQGMVPPLVCADRFLIYPPWAGRPEERAGTPIALDPGLVFGSGLHPTTRHCLSAFSLALRQGAFSEVLDFGTGTGILAVAAALCGTDSVLAIDLNPLCVRTAERNVLLNGVEDRVEVIEGTVEDFAESESDLLFANLHFDLVKVLFENPAFLQTRSYIFSGLMRSQARELEFMLRKRGLDIRRLWDHEMTWFTILAEKG